MSESELRPILGAWVRVGDFAIEGVRTASVWRCGALRVIRRMCRRGGAVMTGLVAERPPRQALMLAIGARQIELEPRVVYQGGEERLDVGD